MISGLSAPDIIPPQSGQNLVSVFTECGGISYFRDSDDEPHVLQNRSSILILALLLWLRRWIRLSRLASAFNTHGSISSLV